MAKWLSVRVRTKWLWFRIPLLSIKLRCRACFEQGVQDIQATIEFRLTIALFTVFKLDTQSLAVFQDHISL